MDTFSLVRPTHHARVCLTTTEPTEFVDVTDAVVRAVADAGIDTGIVNIQTTHTTTAVLVNEAEPLLLEDFRALLARVAPLGVAYRHDDLPRRRDIPPGEPRNGHAHCRALLLPVSATLNVVAGRLILGRWQKVFLVELDGPRRREVSVTVTGAAQ